MDISEIIVLIGGVGSIAFVLWYFFAPHAAVAAHAGESGAQEVEVTIKGGYSPDTITLKQGVPARLDFFRDEESSCSEQLLIPDLGIARDLPAHQTTQITFTPGNAGEFPFTCGMHMMRGKLIVSPNAHGRNVGRTTP